MADTGTRRDATEITTALYGDLPAPNIADASSGAMASSAWAANRSKMMMPPALRKRERPLASSTPTEDSKRLQQSAAAPTSSSSQPFRAQTESSVFSPAATPALHAAASNSQMPPGSASRSPATSWQPRGAAMRASVEYDPAKPNNFEQIMRERALKKRQRDLERQRAEELAEKQREATQKEPAGNPLHISGEEAYRRRAALSGAPPPPPVEKAEPEGSVVALKMMQKMGWKAGEGLGRDKQGIIAPLVARKTDRNSGIIVQGSIPRPRLQRNGNFDDEGTPATRILMLTNACAPADADEELKSECEEEAAKYGNLLDLKVEVASQEDGAEAVRIYLHYEDVAESKKALIAFNGRLFAGRSVRARYVQEEEKRVFGQKSHTDRA